MVGPKKKTNSFRVEDGSQVDWHFTCEENNLFLMQRTSSECVANEIGLKMVVWTCWVEHGWIQKLQLKGWCRVEDGRVDGSQVVASRPSCSLTGSTSTSAWPAPLSFSRWRWWRWWWHQYLSAEGSSWFHQISNENFRLSEWFWNFKFYLWP